MRINVGCIVEGQGEEEALPLLLRRITSELLGRPVDLRTPTVRVHRHKIIRGTNSELQIDDYELKRAAELAARNIGQDGALIMVLDADDDLACAMAPMLLQRLDSTHGHLERSVVFPVKEFETWFLGAAASLAGYRGLPEDLQPPPNVETIRDAKGWLSARMDRRYSPSVDQAKFAARFDLQVARSVPSFDKLCRDVDRLVTTLMQRQT